LVRELGPAVKDGIRAEAARTTHRKMGTGQAAIGNYIDDAVGSVAYGRS
jgi:hypothetical protein